MLGLLLRPYYVYTSNRADEKRRRLYEEEDRRSRAEAQSRTNAEIAEKDRIREEWNATHTVDEKYRFVMRFTEPGRYPPNVVPIPEMAKWWDETGYFVDSWRCHLANYPQYVASLKQLGADAYDYGPYRKELRKSFAVPYLAKNGLERLQKRVAGPARTCTSGNWRM